MTHYGNGPLWPITIKYRGITLNITVLIWSEQFLDEREKKFSFNV